MTTIQEILDFYSIPVEWSERNRDNALEYATVKYLFHLWCNSLQRVSFVPQFVAEEMIPGDHKAMISITEPRHEANLRQGWKHLHRCQFHDVDKRSPGMRLFDEDQAAAMIKFIKEMKNQCRHIIVHCAAGISRSAAVALFIHDVTGAKIVHPFTEVDELHKTDLYNRHVYSMLRKAWEKETEVE